MKINITINCALEKARTQSICLDSRPAISAIIIINLTVDQFTTGENVLWKSIPSCCIPPCTYKQALCLISSSYVFLYVLKLRINRIMCAEVGSDDSGSISQTYSVVKSFISFSITYMESLQSSAFIALPKWRLSFWEVSATRILGYARLIHPSSELRLIRSMWSMVPLNIDTFDNSFLMVSIEPGFEVCRKALYWKVKRPSDIVAACMKLFGLTTLRPDLVFIDT